MKKLLLLLVVSPSLVQAQSAPPPAMKPAAKPAAQVADVCAPMGRTAKGELVYSMKCDNLPVPPSPPSSPQAGAPVAAPEAEPETRRSGLFGWSYDRR